MKLKIACLNMWLGGELIENIKQFVGAENPDIIGAQEVYLSESTPPKEPWHIPEKLAETLGYPYHVFAPAFGYDIKNGGRVQFGNAIFSKYPITSSSTVFYDMPYVKLHVDKTHGDHSFMPRNLQHGQIDINGTILHLFNTQGIWGFDGDDNQRRIKMAKTIVREVSDLSHTVLMGDFNVQERTKTAGIIEQALYPVFKDENRTTSFNLKRQTKSGYKTAVVDMMFTSQDVSVVEHHVSDADVSDHLALVTTIEL